MTEAFLIQNQHQQFLDKHGTWVDGSEAQTLYKTAHKDEAINIKVEHSVKDVELRLSIVSCKLNEKGFPIVEHALPPANASSIEPEPTPSQVLDTTQGSLFSTEETTAEQNSDQFSSSDLSASLQEP